MSQFEALGVSHPVHKFDNPCIIAHTGKRGRRPIKHRLRHGPGNAQRDLIDDRQVMSRSSTFRVVPVNADCDLADRQTELLRHNDVPGLMKRGPAKLIVGLHLNREILTKYALLGRANLLLAQAGLSNRARICPYWSNNGHIRAGRK